MSSPLDPAAQQLTDTIVKSIDGDDFRAGLAACRMLNQQYPGYAYGWYLASYLMKRTRNLRGALRTIESALRLEDADKYRLHQAKCLVEFGDVAAAAAAILPLRFKVTGDARLHSELGSAFLSVRQYDAALHHFSQAVELDRSSSEFQYNKAALLRFLGDIDGAEAGFDAVIALKPTEYEAYNVRSQLRTQTAGRNHVAQLEDMIAQTHDPVGLTQLHYALAKEQEDLQQFAAAFESLERGAAAKRKHMRYSVETDLGIIDAICQSYGPDKFDGHVPGCPIDGPIFVLGMPRTGTTLVERILDTHPAVQSAGELNNFSLELIRLVNAKGDAGASRLEFVAATTKIDFAQLGDAYLASTRAVRDESPYFIDKLPFNFLYAGLIHLALPRAKIINLRRHPLDTCYAVYKTLFKDAYPFSYDLQELARYYVAYDRLMRHWHAVMPGVIHTLCYEDIVTDIAGETRRLLEYCGLPWEEACLRFHDNKRASTTASATQVRQPLYDSSVGKWRRVERQLQPVRDILSRAGIRTD